MTTTKLVQKLKNKQYRDAFVASQIDVGVPFQIRALRERRKMRQEELAALSGMKQPRISAIERPGHGDINLKTLRRIASAFDIALIVRFAPFSELVSLTESFSPDTFNVPSFSQDIFQAITSSSQVIGRQGGPIVAQYSQMQPGRQARSAEDFAGISDQTTVAIGMVGLGSVGSELLSAFQGLRRQTGHNQALGSELKIL
ncbi:MAG TPA: helix-turn-helix transcriptional regulator [Candidatus Binatia bacterium]|nr:helix-turn-helix transcriptional regulator [Candidatus Binatia bacterium]